MSTPRRLRATFLLKLVALGASVALFALVFVIVTSWPVRIGTITFLLLFWFIGVEGELLPKLIEHLAMRRAARGQEPVESVWFIDVDAEERRQAEGRRREKERLRESVRDNPTLW